jgi:hypothetical protein
VRIDILVAQDEKTAETPEENEISDERVDIALKVFRGEVVK